jgi:serine/threonine-protein kinase RsbW
LPKKLIKYRLKFPGQSDNLEIIRDTVSRIAEKVGFNEGDISKIELAVDEACANVIKHAFQGKGAKPIDIDITVESNKFTIIVGDRGKGFDVSKLRKPDMNEYLSKMRVGGLGIFLIQTLMDEVHFESKPGKGTHVKMIKFISNEKLATRTKANAYK